MSGSIPAEGRALAVHWAGLTNAKYDRSDSGDGFVIMERGRNILFAVADGTGSGPLAAETTHICLRTFEQSRKSDLSSLFGECHVALSGGRGVALGIGLIDRRTLSLNWASVGDIDGAVWHDAESRHKLSIYQNRGTVGQKYGSLNATTGQLGNGDLIVLATDGIARSYKHHRPERDTPEATVHNIMQEHGRSSDDSGLICLSVGQIT